jgi:hypothetical protein
MKRLPTIGNFSQSEFECARFDNNYQKLCRRQSSFTFRKECDAFSAAPGFIPGIHLIHCA